MAARRATRIFAGAGHFTTGKGERFHGGVFRTSADAGEWKAVNTGLPDSVEARKALDENTLLIAMVETAAALENVEAIAAVPGIDVVHIGSSDLSSDLGHPGPNTHPKVVAAIERVVAACRKHGKVPGMGGLSGGDPKNYELAVRLGARFFSAANEWSLMMQAGEERVRMLRSLSGAARPNG
jgi:2-keto-3-deoxy-L-rhamnonate aldolase RhmA